MRGRGNAMAFVLVGGLLASLLVGGPAAADFSSVDELTDALDLAGGVVEDAMFTGDEAGATVLSDPLAGFPTQGSSFLVLSTGLASDITEPDDEGNRSTDLGGPPGAAGEDQVQLQLQLDPPANATCLTFDFRFFSEEFPEWVGSEFNDTFTAEIVDTDLQYQSNTIVTPYNFAYDGDGNAISVNSLFGVEEEGETTFDGATPLLQAVTPAERNDDGDVLVTLTIQDVGDSIYDSAVALDNARWSTAADCTAGATIIDSDEDGLPDEWETAGLDVDDDGTVDVDLPAMGADPERKDLFLEIDWMFEDETCIWFICWGGEDFTPEPLALEAVADAFADAPVDNPDGSTGITAHIDAGSGSLMDPATGDTWGDLSGGNAVPHQDNLGGSTGGSYDWSAFDAVKADHFADVRRDVFHYTIYADRYNNGGSSGISRGILGSDLIVSQGAFNDGDGFTLTQERGTLMHELGHNLALRHGGDENANRKPNYLSIMSYSFQLVGLRLDGIDGTLDYSGERLADLDEGSLDETAGLDPDALVGDLGTRWTCPAGTGRAVDDAAGAIDWNCNGDADDEDVIVDVNDDGGFDVLGGHDDWAALRFDGGAIGALGDDELPETTPDEELTRELAEELGVLNGAYDALLAGPSTALLLPDTGDRDITLELRNAGTEDDTYTVATATDLPNFTAPEEIALDAGETGALASTVDTTDLPPGAYELAVTVDSDATGETVGTHTVAVTVPDLSDPDVFAAAEEALAELEELEEGEGPPAGVLEQLIDMLEEALRPDPRPALEKLRDDLVERDDPQYRQAVAALGRALEDRLWVADDELATNGGPSVFAQLQQVVRELLRADDNPEERDEAVETVVLAARDLLERKIELGGEDGVDEEVLDEAAAYLGEGDAAAEDGDPRSAVLSYQDGWAAVNDAQG